MKLLEEYKLVIAHIYMLTERRQNVTVAYLSVNAAIIGIISFLFASSQFPEINKYVVIILVLAIGFLACDFWRRLILQYGLLMGWWYGKLRDLENRLPDSSKLFSKEYEDLYGSGTGKSVGLMRYEIRLTWLFMLVYLILAAMFLLSLVGKII